MKNLKKVCVVGALALFSSCIIAGHWFGAVKSKASTKEKHQLEQILKSPAYMLAKDNPIAYRVMMDKSEMMQRTQIVQLLSAINGSASEAQTRARNNSSPAGEWEQAAIDDAHAHANTQ